MGERVSLVVDGIDGRVHHMEFKDPARIKEVGRNMIVETVSVVSGPRPADRNIAANAEEDNGIYRPNRHLERVRDSFERQGKDPEAFVRSHIRRREALRRAGHVERIDADNWKVPKDIVERGQAYDLSRGADGLRIRTLSAISRDRQVASDGATWLDRQIVADDRSEIRDSGFGSEVNKAISRRARRLVERGLANAEDRNVRVPVDTVATLERQEIDRIGQQDGDRTWPDLCVNQRRRVCQWPPRWRGQPSQRTLRNDRERTGLSACTLATPPREAHWPAHRRPTARRWRHRVDLGKKPRAQLVMQPERGATAPTKPPLPAS